MRRFLLLSVAIAAFVATATAHAEDVGVAINLGPPIYGPLDLQGYPQPVFIYPEPVIIQRGAAAQPRYLHVPPGHAKNWAKHCHRYNACGAPVYFVQESWYRDVYAPRYYQTHRGKPGKGKGHNHD